MEIVMVKKMTKDQFIDMMRDLLIRNTDLDLNQKDFWGWEDWFTYGELNRGRRNIACHVSTKEQKTFLRKWKFR